MSRVPCLYICHCGQRERWKDCAAAQQILAELVEGEPGAVAQKILAELVEGDSRAAALQTLVELVEGVAQPGGRCGALDQLATHQLVSQT